MSEHTLSILVKAIGATQAAAQLKGVDSAVSSIGRTAATGVRTAATNIGKIAAVGAVALAPAVFAGIESLATLEDATTSVDGAIKQMGLSGQVTSGQIAAWANEIEANVGAAFDDKDIVQATTTLIRFGKTTPSNLKPAMQVITDLATKTGDVDSAATLLAKALADPTKAAGKLSKNGIILTKVEQDQIKAFDKAGDAASAQKVILDAVARSTEGAALASQGPYRRSLSVLRDVTEDAERALAEGFLPVIEKARDLLQGALAKPETIQSIRDFGQGLAGGLSSLIDIAKNIPWSSIGDAMKLTGQGAKAALDMFTGLPAWVQEAVITGWGLNKLTGGALGSIVSQLGSGLIKGVLGMNAGVVNINAATVNGPGGVPTKGGGGLASLLPALLTAGVITELALIVGPPIRQWALDNGLAGSGDTAGKTQSQIAWEAMHPTVAAETGGLSPDDRQILSDQKRATDDLGVYEQQAIRDANAASNRQIAKMEGLRSAILGITLKAPAVSVLVGGTVVNVSAQSVSASQTTVSTWTGSTKYATAV